MVDINKFLEKTNQEADRILSKAMSKFVNADVNIDIAKVNINLNELPYDLFEKDTKVVSVSLPISGDLEGLSILIFPDIAARRLCDLLLKKEEGTTKVLSDFDISALNETANILCGNYLTVVANKLKCKITGRLPELTQDMFGKTVEQLIEYHKKSSNKAIAIAITFNFNLKARVFYSKFLIAFSVKNLTSLLEVLDESLERINP